MHCAGQPGAAERLRSAAGKGRGLLPSAHAHWTNKTLSQKAEISQPVSVESSNTVTMWENRDFSCWGFLSFILEGWGPWLGSGTLNCKLYLSLCARWQLGYVCGGWWLEEPTWHGSLALKEPTVPGVRLASSRWTGPRRPWCVLGFVPQLHRGGRKATLVLMGQDSNSHRS